jgi:hypothetical protein
MPNNPFESNDRIFDDPFISALNSTINRLRNSIHVGGAYVKAKTLYPSVQELRQFSRTSYSDEERKHALALACSTFSEFEKAYLEVIAEFEAMKSRARLEWKHSMLDDQIKGELQNLEWLRQLKRNISPVHIELQAHFYALVLQYPRNPEANSSEAAEFFEPLYELRNEYFLRPSTSVLSSYRSMSRKLQEAPYYSEVLRAAMYPAGKAVWESIIGARELELEVLSMVEELV